jgi:hypothetical protein
MCVVQKLTVDKLTAHVTKYEHVTITGHVPGAIPTPLTEI